MHAAAVLLTRGDETEKDGESAFLEPAPARESQAYTEVPLAGFALALISQLLRFRGTAKDVLHGDAALEANLDWCCQSVQTVFDGAFDTLAGRFVARPFTAHACRSMIASLQTMCRARLQHIRIYLALIADRVFSASMRDPDWSTLVG
jgi:hypothetical protein